jgi:hypothetical protein
MFIASREFAFFDYMRIPYACDAIAAEAPSGRVGRLVAADRLADGAPPALYWWCGGPGSHGDELNGRFRVDDFWIAGKVSVRPPTEILGAETAWSAMYPVTDVNGAEISAIWANDRGSVYLPFDPSELMSNLWSERYLSFGRAATARRARKAVVRCYYAIRPLLPRRLQLRLRRAFANHQKVPDFPAWPIEHSLHDLYAMLLHLVTEVAAAPVPWVGPWPDGKTWAMVLTHDVETSRGRDTMALLRDAERERGYKSSWNFVPERYDVTEEMVANVREDHCEVGLHGLRHDGRDLASRRMLTRRLPAMRAAADRWGAVGFRAPATQRGWDLMPMLGMDYDSSYTDTDPFEPQPGGCCTYWPYFNSDLVELPITLPQDHTLFEILKHVDGEVWLSKARMIRQRGGMVLVLAHPDYASDGRLARAWNALLDEFTDDDTVWQPLAGEVARWWRDRAATTVRRAGREWQLEGPASARGRVFLTTYIHRPSASEVS